MKLGTLRMSALLVLSFLLLALSSNSSKAQVFASKVSSDKERSIISGEVSELHSVLVRVLDLPGSGQGYIHITGVKANVTNNLGEVSQTVQFRGVPFAHAPVGDLRFQRPTMRILRRDFHALEHAPACPQLSINGNPFGSEDCLSLNIFMPQDATRESRLPVLIWFHGESWEKSQERVLSVLNSGSARDLQTDVFLQHKMIVVTPQYRLGSLGFLSTANEDLSGNMALFDQLLALEWVQRFIVYFGGDPNQVTLMGHGSAAMSLGLLTTSSLSKGLYHRLILMGGSPLSPLALDPSPKSTFAEAAFQNSCPTFPSLSFVRCMQQRHLEHLLKADERLFKGKHLGIGRMTVPVIQKSDDGRFLPPILSRSPLSVIYSSSFEGVPMILGVSRAEMNGFLSNVLGKPSSDNVESLFPNEKTLKQFVRKVTNKMTLGLFNRDTITDLISFEYFAALNVTERPLQGKDAIEELLSDILFNVPALTLATGWSRKASVYFYVFDYVPNLGRGNIYDQSSVGSSQEDYQAQQAFHGSDLRFLMEGHAGSADDRVVANALIDFWVHFIFKGSPLNAGRDWPQFRPETQQFLHVSNNDVTIASNFRMRAYEFWNNLVPIVSRNICQASRSLIENDKATYSREFYEPNNDNSFNNFGKQQSDIEYSK